LKDIDVDGDDEISGASPRLTPPPQSIDDDACSTDIVAKDPLSPTCSTDTVAKDYFGGDRTTRHEPELKSTEKPMDFISFLRTWNVSLVVRLNFANEPGMIQEYDASKMASYGIEHKDLPIDDHRGGMPDRSSVEKALETLADHGGEPILVHCKGGFGRSVVLACCILIDRLNISGAALLGWARLCRPGAVTTVTQERFLRSLRGRDDLRRFTRTEGAPPSCGCSMQ
jgi:hypothetical protein